ncbi:MAG: Calx-beta domain-containing protein [Abyssibacter sp.]|uniref:Calx-beta domain-containing protein n=1 Tax=Abyssibacter sp. TaxID=2320200 RepID=UPI00321ACA3B
MKKLVRAALGIAFVCAVSPALAVSVEVDTGGMGSDCSPGHPAGSCSLREAIAFINTQGTSSVHAITFASGVTTVTVQAPDLPDIVVPVAINGPVTINCEAASLGGEVPAAFAFTTAQSDGYRVDNLNLVGCETSNSRGGAAIYFNPSDGASTLTVDGVTIQDTEASAGPGGAIKIAASHTADISNTVIENASAETYGGAIDNQGFLTLSNSQLLNNSLITSAFAESNGAGAGLSSRLATTGGTALDGVVITGNDAGGDNGGGIYAEMQFSALSFTINNTLISNNQAANGAGLSIGLNGPIEITNSTISGNTADGGGSPGAEGAGGAIYLDAVNSNGAVLRASNCTLSGNNADVGAAIAADPSVQKASAMTNCTIAFNGDGAGNGIEMPGTQLEKVFPGNTNNPFAKNLLVGNAPQNCTGLFDHLNDTSNSGSNLASDMSCGFTQGTDSQVAGAAAVMIDTNLTDNGGATPTHRLLVGSPAIDLGNAIGTTGDQRGAPAADGTNDMTDAVVRDSGAYEFAGFSAVEFANPSLSVDEDDTPLQFVLRRYGDVTQALTGVSISTEEGSADASDDYDATPMPATIDFAAGVTTSAQIDVGIVDDTTDEEDEDFSLLIGGVAAWDLGAQQPANVTIREVEVGTVEFEFDDSSNPLVVSEDAGTLTVTLTRTGGTDKQVQVVVNSTDGTASSVGDEDYVAINDLTVTFPDGSDSQTFNVRIIDDNAYDPDNIGFTLTLSEPADQPANFELGTNSVLNVEIDSEDAAMAGEFSLTEAGVNVTEGVNTEAEFTVQRLSGSDCTVTVAYSTASGTADAGSDFTGTSGNLIFNDGNTTSQTISIPIADDTVREGDERFALTLDSADVSNCESGASAILASPSTGTVVIRSDEQVQFGFEQTSWAANEADGQVEISVRPLQAVTGDDVVIGYETMNGSATAPEDYAATSGTLTWTDGEGTDAVKSFSVPLVADDDAEGNEGFTVELTSMSAYAEISGTNPTPVTIEDRLGIRFTDTTFVSDRENGGTIVATVERVGAATQAAQVDISTAQLDPVSAESDVDYQAKTEVVTWAAGDDAPKTVTFSVIGDTELEGDEQFRLVLDNEINAILVEPSTATAVITDDDSTVALDAATYSVIENEGVVTVSLTRTGAFGEISVDYATADGSAVAGTDYTATNGTVTWLDGESGAKTVTVAVLNDDAPESAKDFSLTLSNPQPAGTVTLVDPTTTTITIADDDSIVEMDAVTLSVDENGGTVTVSASRSGSALGPASVNIATTDGTAISGIDYDQTSAGLSWVDGETGSKSVSIPILDNTDVEGDLTFAVALSAPTPTDRTHLGTQTQTDVTIVDNDSIIELASATVTAVESDGSLVISATRTGSFGAATVNYATADGSAQAGTHYGAASGTFEWADGEDGTQSVTISLTDDADVNADRDFSLSIDTPSPSANVQLGSTTTTAVTLTNDDSTISLTTASLSAPEGDGQIVFIAERTGDFGAATIDFATADGSATAPGDYTANSGSLSWNDGEAGQKMITVTIADNDVVDADRDFSLTLSNPDPNTRVRLGAIDAATATILDDDTVITLDAATASAIESDGTVTLTATRSGTRGTATVTVRTADGSAAAGVHYTGIDSSLSWADGEDGSKSITVEIADDLVVNDDRDFTLSISNPMPSGLVQLGAVTQSAITVVNNDSSIAMEVASVSAVENDGTVTLRAVRTGGFGAASVDFATADGSAQAGTHYTAASGTLNWADGQTGAMEFSITLQDDTEINADRDFSIALSNPTPGTRVVLAGQASTTVTVRNDDAAFSMAAPSVSVEEGEAEVSVTVQRVGSAVGEFSVLVSTADGTATAPANYTAFSERVVWADGDAESKTVSISLQDDSVVNEDRSFSIQLSAGEPSGSTTITDDDTTVVTIVDDETTVSFAADSYTVVEGGMIEVFVERAGSTSGPASVTYTTVDGTATAGSHYTAASGTLTWADGDDTPQSFSIDVADDGTLNADRQFTIELSQPDPAVRVLLTEPTTATVTIEDNETQVRFESSSYTASEGDGSVSLVVQRIGMGMGTVTVDYAVNGGTATRNTDYSVADGTLTWSDGDTANKTIRISLTDDPVAERTETVVLTLSNVTSNGEETPLGDPASAVLSITDNDDAGFVVEPSAGSLTVREGGAAAAATVALTSRPLADVTVSFETPSRVTVRTANTADSTRLVFTPSNWNISQTVELLAVDDAEEQETVTLTVTARTQSLDNNYDNLSDTLDVTIEDNDGQSTGGGGSGALGAGWMLIMIGLGLLRRRWIMR